MQGAGSRQRQKPASGPCSIFEPPCHVWQVADFGLSRELMLTGPLETASYGTVTHSALGSASGCICTTLSHVPRCIRRETFAVRLFARSSHSDAAATLHYPSLTSHPGLQCLLSSWQTASCQRPRMCTLSGSSWWSCGARREPGQVRTGAYSPLAASVTDWLLCSSLCHTRWFGVWQVCRTRRSSQRWPWTTCGQRSLQMCILVGRYVTDPVAVQPVVRAWHHNACHDLDAVLD